MYSVLRPLVRNGCIQFTHLSRLKAPQNATFSRVFMHSGPAPGVPVKGLNTKPPSRRQIIKYLLENVWPKDNPTIRKRVIIALGVLAAAKTVNACVPFLLRDVVDAYAKIKPETPEVFLAIGVSGIVAYGVFRAANSALNELRNAVFAKVDQHSLTKTGRKIFEHLHNLSLSFHVNRQTGAMYRAIDRGVRGMSFVQRSLVFNIVPTLLEFSFVSGILYVKCGPIFAVITMSTFVTYAAATIGITMWRTKFRHQMNEADNNANNKAVDSLVNYETVKLNTNEKFEAVRYAESLKLYEDASLKTAYSLSLLNSVQGVIFSAGMIASMYLAAINITNGTMTVGDMVMINALLIQLGVPLNFLGSVYREIRQGFQDMQAMFSLLNLKSDIIEKPNAQTLVVTPQNAAIKFDNVVFGYDPTQEPLINGLSLEVPTGKKVAIVGGTGTGKSTIFRLLCRLYDSNSGAITVNDQNVRNVTLNSLRRSIAIVPQDIVLFHDTIGYNIRYGNIEATQEQVEEAAKLADVHDAILRMKDGYNTVVGERGLKLSGGEKQRIAIARALIRNANIIIYDEATSSLDSSTEQNIMNSLKKAAKDKTSLFIAHRLASIADSDIIYVLENGRIREHGSHDQLMKLQDGKYAQLWDFQHKQQDDKPSRRDKEDELDLEEMDPTKCCGKGGCNKCMQLFDRGFKMSSCFEQLRFDNFQINWEEQRNNISSIGAGFLFALGIWLYIDTAAVYKADWNNVYILVTIASCVAMFMVNSVSNSQIHGGSYDYEGILGTRGARFWLMLAFILSFASLVAATWLMFSEYVLREGNDPKWPGVALFLNNFLIFAASLVYKFGRQENQTY